MTIQERSELFPNTGGDLIAVRTSIQALAVGRGLLNKMRDSQDEVHSPVYEWNPEQRGSALLALDFEQSTHRSLAEMYALGEASEVEQS